jgi:hypothetical protein
MKRTKNINHASFRKSWSARHLTPVALAVTASLCLPVVKKATKRFRCTKTPMTALPPTRAKPPNAPRLTTTR